MDFDNETFINKGHEYADMAEQCEQNKKYESAVEYHRKAASEFALAINNTTEEEVKLTLQILVENQLRLAEQSILIENSTIQASNINNTSNFTPNESMQFKDSFMILKQFNELDVNDPFEKFWNKLEDLVNKGNKPNAFTSYKFDHKSITHNPNNENQKLAESFFVVSRNINSNNNSTDNETDENEHLIKENLELKKKVKDLSLRILQLENFLEHNNSTLKNSIHQFKNEIMIQYTKLQNKSLAASSNNMSTNKISKQAILSQSNIGSRSVINGPKIQNFSPLTSSVNNKNNADLKKKENNRTEEPSSKVKELLAHIEKQDAVIAKYKDRWSQLKLAAKSKRQSRQNSEPNNLNN